MSTHTQKIIILDFGSQTTQLIARRIREQKVYSEIHPYTLDLERLKAMRPTGVILSGGPASVYDDDAPISDPGIYELGVPILGICFGAQVMMGGPGGRGGEGPRLPSPLRRPHAPRAELTSPLPAAVRRLRPMRPVRGAHILHAPT